ncbi:MAG: hypothetical protein J1F64_11510, partial [Oscillospiraceae bacterium]|nr:hypothetical protein [Oscillospiraceae bacterium]
AGMHTIRLYNESPGVVIDKFVITTGVKKESYYGAPESYNTEYNRILSVLPEASNPARKQTGNITALFNPEFLIAAAAPGMSDVTLVNLTKADGVYTVVMALYDDDGNMLDVKFTPKNISADDAFTVFECSKPSAENAAEIQIMILKGEISEVTEDNTYEAVAPAMTVSVSDSKLFASYDNCYVYPMTRMNDYYGKESVCVIESDDGEIKYIRQNTVEEGTYSKVPFNGNGKHTLKIKIAGEEDIITETFNTIVNIRPDTDPTSETLYNWDFSTDQTSTGANVPVLGGPAVYDETNKCIRLTSEAKSGGSVTATFDDPISAAHGETIIIKTDIAYGHLSGKYTDYIIKDSAGNELVSSHINAYATGVQSIKVGGVEQLDGSASRPGMPSLGTGGTFNAKMFVTYTTEINFAADTITLTTH